MDFDFEEDLEELKAFGNESDADFAERVALRNKGIAMCNKAKQEFAKEMQTSSQMLVKLAGHNFVQGPMARIHDELASKASNYGNYVN